jgi:hypothetical protein
MITNKRLAEFLKEVSDSNYSWYCIVIDIIKSIISNSSYGIYNLGTKVSYKVNYDYNASLVIDICNKMNSNQLNAFEKEFIDFIKKFDLNVDRYGLSMLYIKAVNYDHKIIKIFLNEFIDDFLMASSDTFLDSFDGVSSLLNMIYSDESNITKIETNLFKKGILALLEKSRITKRGLFLVDEREEIYKKIVEKKINNENSAVVKIGIPFLLKLPDFREYYINKILE